MREALTVVWEASDKICGKRLKAALPTMVDSLERHGHLNLDPDVRRRLFSVSAATIDRLLKPIREQAGSRRKCKQKRRLDNQVPFRNFADWNEPEPGYLETIEMLPRTNPIWLKAAVIGTWVVLMGAAAYGLLFLRGDRVEPHVEHPQAVPTLTATRPPARTPTSPAMSASSLYFAGLDYLIEDDYDRAIEEFTKAIKLDPMTATYYEGRALAHIEAESPQEAINDYNKALVLEPDNADFHLRRAVAYIRRGDRIRAIEDLEKFLEIAPNHLQRAEALELLGILRRQNRE